MVMTLLLPINPLLLIHFVNSNIADICKYFSRHLSLNICLYPYHLKGIFTGALFIIVVLKSMQKLKRNIKLKPHIFIFIAISF